MFRRPSSRLKTSKEPVALNLVPMLDALITLIAFLLFSMSFVAIVGIESLVPIVNEEPIPQLKDKPLQLTLTLGDRESELWSPFERFESKVIPNKPNGNPDADAIHTALLTIKELFPLERQIVFVPASSVNYDALISVMDSARQIEKGDPPLYYKHPTTGVDRTVTELFPNIVFGNLLAEDGGTAPAKPEGS